MNVAASKTPANLLQEQASQFLRQGKTVDALRCLNDALVLDKENSLVHNQLAITHFHAGNMAESERSARKALELDPAEAAFRINLGEACREQGKWAEAEAAYREVLEAIPNHAPALSHLSSLYLLLQRLAEAETYAHEALAAAPDLPAAHKAMAAVYLNRGIFSEAETHINRALSATPNYVDALLLLVALRQNQKRFADAELALTHLMKTRPDMAEAYIRKAALLHVQGKAKEELVAAQKAISLKPFLPAAHIALGNAYRAKRNFVASQEAYQAAINLCPQFAEAHASLANSFVDQGKLEEAELALEKAMSLRPDSLRMYLTFSTVLMQQKRDAEAVAVLHRALEIDAGFVPAIVALGAIYVQEGKSDEAEAWFKQALEREPGNHDAQFKMGLLLYQKNIYAPALEYFANTVAAVPSNRTARVMLVECFRSVKVTEYSPNLATAIETCLKDETLSKQHMATVWHSVMWRHPELSAVIRTMDLRSYEEFQRYVDVARGDPAFVHPYLLLGIPRLVVPNLKFERFMVWIRHYLLDTQNEEVLTELKPLLRVLPIQHFLTEFIGEETAEETAKVEILRATLSEASPLTDILLYACYRLLGELDEAEAISKKLHAVGNPALSMLAEMTIDNVLAERALQHEIPSWDEVSDSVSLAVQNQYEENPYPRWQQITLSRGRSLPEVVKELFPYLKAEAIHNPSKLNVLIPGCGTGQQAVMCANRFSHAQVLAVDLSCASLAYAVRRSRELGVDNIRFMQGDILKLPKLVKEPFDYIECTGVLHHMQDPLGGWRVLNSMLKPEGYMKIALYSETARKAVVAARGFIAERGFKPTLEGIRSCRKEIMQLPNWHPVHDAMYARDFYMTSECRDLIFHVQEHRFTLPKIKALLEEFGMEFLGLEFQNKVTEKQYRSLFPEDPNMTNLDNWAKLEELYPRTFISMYQLWMRRKR